MALAQVKKCKQFASCNLQFCKVPALPPPYKACWVVKLTCQYDFDFQGVRISHTTLENIHLNKSLSSRRKQKFPLSVFCFNMLYYPMSKILFSTLEMLSTL